MADNLKSFSTFGGVVSFVLTLATWIFFYEWSLPLDVAGTTVVFGAWFLLAVAGRWIWARVRSQRH
jgi:uncharacterized membrane protein